LSMKTTGGFDAGENWIRTMCPRIVGAPFGGSTRATIKNRHAQVSIFYLLDSVCIEIVVMFGL
jgi:hypothetical protein